MKRKENWHRMIKRDTYQGKIILTRTVKEDPRRHACIVIRHITSITITTVTSIEVGTD